MFKIIKSIEKIFLRTINKIFEPVKTKEMFKQKGDKVTIKDKQWYEANKDIDGDVVCPTHFMAEPMSKYCGETTHVIGVDVNSNRLYKLAIDGGEWFWSIDMFESDNDVIF